MEDKILQARLNRLEYKADQAKQYADTAHSNGYKTTTTYWDGVEAAYRTSIHIMQGRDYC